MDRLGRLLMDLKAARGADRKLDRRILHAISGRVVDDTTFVYGRKHGTREITTAYPYRWSCYFAPHYTSSFETALTLLPSKMVYVEISGSTDTLQPGVWPAVSIRWCPPGETDYKKWHGAVHGAPTFALAMCCASIDVRAREYSSSTIANAA